MKFKVLFLTLLLFIALFTGCTKKNTDQNQNTQGETTSTETNTASNTGETTTGEQPDTVTTASIVDSEDAFVKAISKEGTWIIAIIKDLTVNQDLNLEGEFKNGKKDDQGKDEIQRKIALYSQDENRNITARYTLTAPKITINSPMASIQHGTFKGDVYVNVSDFQLIDATVDGNVYFTTDDAKSTFKMDDTSKITGKQELKK
ncbi:hypothetical protein Ana3638_16015 [Anaerocolumna sedimenticola]|uniref:Lipoprotein n=1 Tax=Anaerocolumna sedimenticola TaxID=2696063 RepID=A0A6P1TRG1_9FIRM|nr:hypothetical protein [Anaerocolumna sedimenticola]QHQ62105.1 hypothetical protein Ana3638_16015 [Anaerocolumna sedimenticola]